MSSPRFDPVLTRVLASRARTKLISTLVEERGRWFTATDLCSCAGVSETTFHRDQKAILMDAKVVERRQKERNGRELPMYSLAETEQAEAVADAHYALQKALHDDGTFIEETIHEFVR